MLSRRNFLQKSLMITGLMLFDEEKAVSDTGKKTAETRCMLYRSVNGRPDENINQMTELMGGIETLIGPDDVVLIKPNAQWWNQGAPNLLSLKALVDLIMERPGGFSGEVLIGENCHSGDVPWKSTYSGWVQSFQHNSDIQGISNLSELGKILKENYGERFSLVHWIDITAGGKRVYTPQDGSGYVYCDGTGGVPLIKCDNGLRDNRRRETIMTYPIFISDRGTTIDFRYGIWNNGQYIQQPFKFINFSALNHHSTYCGATSAVKNYLGISDLSGGPDPENGGILTDTYYNFHSFPLNKWASGPVPGMLGKEIGIFMNTIRKADLNITTAEWTGLSTRTDFPVAQTRAVLACTDPVALDYHAAKYILFPNSRISVHNPDNKTGPLHQYLLKCAEQAGLIFDEEHIKIVSFDFATKSIQKDTELVIHGKKQWGSNMKNIMKYLALRMFS